MEPLQFTEVRNLLSACRLAAIDSRPINSEKGAWELYRGTYRVHVIEVPFELLYIYARARKDAIERAAKTAFVPKETFVVYAPSADAMATIKKEFEKTAKGFWSINEYLASFMRHELEAYERAITRLAPNYYVQPSVQPPSGTSHRFPNPLELFLKDPTTGAEAEGVGSVAVVLAEAGHGKTYMCEWLVARLAQTKTGVLPIFVNSSLWQKLRPEELLSFATTVVSSFRALGAPIPWVEGQEDLFLKVVLKAGLFRLVFDGFDEYILRMPGEIGASQTLNAIATLATETGTRVLLTSRTSFWQSENPTSFQDGSTESRSSNVFVYRLAPFDVNLARNYFELRFRTDSKKIERAVAMFRELSKDDPSFAGRGFVLLLIADLVESGEDLGSLEKPIIRLMRAHCERERKRHELPLTANQQLDALKEFVFEVAQGAEPTTDLLLISIQLAAPELTEDDARISAGKMAPHALILGQNGRWTIRQPQVQVALMAMQLLEIAGRDANGRSLLQAFSAKRLDPGFESDLAAMLSALCQWEKPGDHGLEAVRKVIRAFFDASQGALEVIRTNVLRRLCTLMALRVVDQSRSDAHLERTNALAGLFPSGRFEGVVFFGGLARFDWSGTTFENSVFDNVRWSNCQFSSTTTFRGCLLLGGSLQYSPGFAECEWIDCYTDDLGRQFRDNEAVRSGKRAYAAEHLKQDIFLVLEKFLGKGGVGFRSLDAADLQKGKISASLHKDKIIDGVCKHLLEEHHLGGGSSVGLKLKDTAKDAVRALVANNAWTGDLALLIDDLQKRIGIGN